VLGLACLVLAIPFTASAQDAYTTRSVNIRGGPDTTYPPVAVLPPGAPVDVQGCLDDWSWCDVVFGDDRGWVYAPYLSYVYQGARVPFYTYAPSFGIPIVTFSVGSYWDRYYRGRPFYGRRDYWERRAPPQHFRPSGPAPRDAAPPFRERADIRNQNPRGYDAPGFAGNRGAPPAGENRFNRGAPSAGDNRPSRDGGGQPRDRRIVQPAPNAAPAPAINRAAQEMHRASPTQAPAPAPAARGGAQGAEPGRGPEGNRGRGGEREGGNGEPHR